MLDLSAPDHLTPNYAYTDIYEQYASESAFLWLLRSIAIKEPHQNIDDIKALETRIDGQLDGLLTSAEIGWQVCEQALDIGESGEVFTALVVAMRCHDTDKIKQAVDVGLRSAHSCHGLVSAMGWLPEDIASPWIERFMSGKDPQHKYLGVAACSVRRKNPGDMLATLLQRTDCQKQPQLYARALRLVGELRRHDCLSMLQPAMQHEDDSPRFWAIWSAILLGQHAQASQLRDYIFKSSPHQDAAIQIAFRILPIEQAREWISELSKDDKHTRVVIKAIGVLGDPHAINWLITKMQQPLYAKLAAESFSYITGVDFTKNSISMDAPDSLAEIPNDDIADDIVDLDEDENLPYPDAVKVATLWQQYGQKFIVGKRYFMGQTITPELLQAQLKNGTQRQRHAAAIELALHEQGEALINTHAKVIN